jgi:hypothetical protein
MSVLPVFPPQLLALLLVLQEDSTPSPEPLLHLALLAVLELLPVLPPLLPLHVPELII